MRLSWIAAVLSPLLVCNAAMAQFGGMANPTPTIGATSPLGIETGSTVSPTGIPLGSTEMASPGISPAPAGVPGAIAMPGSGASCSTMGTSPLGIYGSTATYDGGGMVIGAAPPATGATSGTPMSGTSVPGMSISGMPMSGTSMSSGISATSGMSTTSGMPETSGLSGMCGSGSGSLASSSTPMSTSPTAPGGEPRTGVPLGSIQIGNLGISPPIPRPTISVPSTTGTVGTSVSPTMYDRHHRCLDHS